MKKTEVTRFRITSSPDSWFVALIMAGEPYGRWLSHPILDSFSQECSQPVRSAFWSPLLGAHAIISCQILWVSTSNSFKPWQYQPSACNNTVPSGYGSWHHFFKNCPFRDNCLKWWGSQKYSTLAQQGYNQHPSHLNRYWPLSSTSLTCSAVHPMNSG